jgi:hypothetical protein
MAPATISPPNFMHLSPLPLVLLSRICSRSRNKLSSTFPNLQAIRFHPYSASEGHLTNNLANNKQRSTPGPIYPSSLQPHFNGAGDPSATPLTYNFKVTYHQPASKWKLLLRLPYMELDDITPSPHLTSRLDL